MNKEAILRGFYKRADEVINPVPSVKPNRPDNLDLDRMTRELLEIK